MAEERTEKGEVEYVPPAPETIDKAARAVCRQLGEVDPSFNQSDVVYGLAAFLSVVARIHANHLNTLKRSINSGSLDSK